MSERPPLLSDHLRAATGDSHAGLEAALDLLAEPLSEARFRRTLEGFHGFHRAWEPAIARHVALAPAVAGSSQLPQLRADLRALGRTDAEIDALPACEAAAELVAKPLAAIGSLYVVEGSTLGGQVIARALAATPWAPPDGLRYFDPYGRETGARWRAFKTWLDAAAPEDDWPVVIEGAKATFDTLRSWLSPSLR